MQADLKSIKHLLETSIYFTHCNVKAYIEPSISSAVFVINVSGYRHIFKAPFGLLEVTSDEALADIIITEVLDWRSKYEA